MLHLALGPALPPVSASSLLGAKDKKWKLRLYSEGGAVDKEDAVPGVEGKNLTRNLWTSPTPDQGLGNLKEALKLPWELF